MAVSLNIVTGYLGQLPLGHAGFMLHWWLCLRNLYHSHDALFEVKIVHGLQALHLQLFFCCGPFVWRHCAALIGVVIGIPALRLRGDYLAIITLSFAEIIRVVLVA